MSGMAKPLRAPRRKKCRHCREWFSPPNSLARACSIMCALTLAGEDTRKEQRRKDRKTLDSLKPLSRLCAEAQRDVNAYIRARDAHKGCISCPSDLVDDAGHFFHAGSKYRTSRLRFDHRVIHGQCAKCNRYAGGGNMHGFIDGIRQRYGAQYLADLYELKAQADRGELVRLTKEEVRQIASDNRRQKRELIQSVTA